MVRRFIGCVGALFVHGFVAAEGFEKGPLIEHFGPHASVDSAPAFGPETRFRVAFDVASQSDTGQVNRKFESLARFLNMHSAKGVKPDNIQLALVVHGKAGFDLLSDAAYQEKYTQTNVNIPLLQALLENRVKVILCGQSAAFMGIEPSKLMPGVELALSAMTAHAQLQQQGYTLNPF